MPTTITNLGGQTSGHAPAKIARAAALAGVLVVVSVAINGLIIALDGSLRSPLSTMQLDDSRRS